ncbi:hypothetical protein ACUH96_00915 [Dermabacteraceae bacterium P13077]
MVEVKVKLNRSTVRAVLRSRPVQEHLAREAWRVAKASGEGYRGQVWPWKTRARAEVQATTWKARRDMAENKTPLKVLRGAR